MQRLACPTGALRSSGLPSLESLYNGFQAAMPFKFDPQPIPADHIWKGKYHHLTYKGFIELAAMLDTVAEATTTPIDGYSAVHEDTSYTDEQGVEHEGYKHTHFCVMFRAPIKLYGCRKFDCRVTDDLGFPDYIHPNVQPGVTAAHCELIFTDYHAGRKYSVEHGKTIFKAPVWRQVKLPPLFEFPRAIMEEMLSAPTLVDACLAGQVRPRTVSDVKALRDDAAAAPKVFKPLFDPSTFVKLNLPSWNALHLWGATGLGKTKWACAQASNPCLIKPFNSRGCLEAIKKQFHPGVHDLLILDEADLTFMKRETAIVFLDVDEDCVLDIRFGQFTLPAGVRKILISNPQPNTWSGRLYPEDRTNAILRRLTIYHVTQKLYMTPATPAAAAAALQPTQPGAATPATQVAVPAAIAGWQAAAGSP